MIEQTTRIAFFAFIFFLFFKGKYAISFEKRNIQWKYLFQIDVLINSFRHFIKYLLFAYQKHPLYFECRHNGNNNTNNTTNAKDNDDVEVILL